MNLNIMNISQFNLIKYKNNHQEFMRILLVKHYKILIIRGNQRWTKITKRLNWHNLNKIT